MCQSSNVAIVRSDDIEKAVSKSIDLVDGLSDLPGKNCVSIKPNLCGPKPSDSGQTTDPAVVEAIIKKVNSISQTQICIVESDNSQTTADRTFEVLGYRELEDNYRNVKCVNLSKDAKVRVSLDGDIFSTISVPETLLFSDYFINVSKLKTHVDYLYTGALKNLYGLVLDKRLRRVCHGFMREMLVDLTRLYKPNLSVIDGIVGMEGFGPSDGDPRHLGVIVASKDPVAADSVAARIIGMNPSRIEYLKYAGKKGIGNLENVQVLGCSVEDVQTRFRFISKKWFYFGRLSLCAHRQSMYMFNTARFLSLVRSSLSTIGLSMLASRVSAAGLIRLAKDTILKIDA
jgi:uncharacterized protein (DUF362 family)